MVYSKFKAGDLVRRKSPRDYWKGKLGLILSVEYTHGDPRYIVKWNHAGEPRWYFKNGLARA